MNRKIVVSSLLNRMRIGIVEDGRLVEYYLEHDEEETFTGKCVQGRLRTFYLEWRPPLWTLASTAMPFCFCPI